jgi:hypothetical protein
MLLFVFQRKSGDRRSWARHLDQGRRDARALATSGLFVVFWCSLRLWIASRHGLGPGVAVDIALALLCLLIGLWGVQLGVRALLTELRPPPTFRNRTL